MKFLKHERDKVGDYQRRLLMHIPIGLLIGVPIIGYPILKLFVAYEDSEDFWVHDKAWKDYAGALVGAVIMELIIIGLVIYLLWRFVW